MHASRDPRVLYLDFDGVLHPDEAYWDRKKGVYLAVPGRLFMFSGHLIEALDPHPDVKLVLSTTWVRMLSYSRAKRFLPQALRDRVIGATWHSRYKTDPETKHWWEGASRYETIVGDVLRRRPLAWAAIDDDVQGWSAEHRDHLVATPSPRGLGDPAARARLKTVLNDLTTPGRLPFPRPFDYRGPVITL